MAWLWLLGALVLGGALLVAASTADLRARRAAEREESEVPLRGGAVDAHLPRYVSQTRVDALPSPGTTGDAAGRRFGFGLAHRDLVATSGTASLTNPWVLVVEGDITSMRQILGPASRANEGRGLLIVALGMHDDVGRTLAANRRVLNAQVLASIASPGDLLEVAEFVGAQILTADDLRAGYVPEQAYGTAVSVRADGRRTWVDVG